MVDELFRFLYLDQQRSGATIQTKYMLESMLALVSILVEYLGALDNSKKVLSKITP